MGDNIITTLDYAKEINECQLHVALTDQSIQAKFILKNKLSHRIKELKKECVRTRNAIALSEYELKRTDLQNQCILDCIESGQSRREQLKVQYLEAKQKRVNTIEYTNAIIRKYKEQWSTITKRWEEIPFIKKYLETKEKFETVRENNNAIKIESEKLRSEIALKKAELFEIDKTNIIEMADFIINKRPVFLKLIHEKINEINKLSTSASTFPMIEAKKISAEDAWNSSTKKAYDTLVLPKLHLHYMDLDTITQVQNVDYNRAINKRLYEAFNTVKFTMSKKAKTTEKIDDEDYSVYFTSPRNIDKTNSKTKKYSDKKIINILKDIKLDTAGTYEIVSKVKLNQLQDVNVIKARASQDDSMKNDPPQDTINEKITEVVEEIDLTKKVSQDIILPPTPFLDFTRSSQEKRVTFNNVVEDIPNSEADNDDVPPQHDYNVVNNTPYDQLNASTASDESYKKIKDFVFKKHNVNLSPEFTYTKNNILPMVAEENLVTSKFFDENQANINTDNRAKVTEIIEIINDDRGNPEQEINEVPIETMNQDNFTAENVFEGQEYKQKDDVPSCGPSFPYIQSMPDSLNISMSTTGYEDTEFPARIDSSFLLSPKAYDEMPNRDDDRNINVLPQDGAGFMSGFKKTAFQQQNPKTDSNFNFTFSTKEKKRGGFFSMFQ